MKNLEIYVHIPFCVRKCGYCDFLSAPADQDTQEKYVQALEREIRGRAEEYREYQVPTVFIGGGTPSLLGPERMGRLLDTMGCCYRILPGAEITMEANPCTVDYDSLVQYRKAGVSRLSLGLQSSWDEELRALGRIHTWQQFLDTYGAAAAAGFAHINVDLMSGLPGQTPGSYETTLKRVAELEPGPEHISAYSLILEEGTAFAERYGAGELLLPNEETERELYGLTKHILREYGYQRYEISNYAKEGCECRHNVGYWTRENYLGFGIGAASLVENVRFRNGDSLQAYLEEPLGQREQEHKLTVAEQMEEFMFLGLRESRGICANDFKAQFGVSIHEIFGRVLQKHIDQKLMVSYSVDGGSQIWYALTDYGVDVSNYVFSEYLLE